MWANGVPAYDQEPRVWRMSFRFFLATFSEQKEGADLDFRVPF